jgi:hypothetical protein
VRVKAGQTSQLWEDARDGPGGATTLLAVQAVGERIRCQVDERLVCDILEPLDGPSPSGAVGLYTWNSGKASPTGRPEAASGEVTRHADAPITLCLPDLEVGVVDEPENGSPWRAHGSRDDVLAHVSNRRVLYRPACNGRLDCHRDVIHAPVDQGTV